MTARLRCSAPAQGPAPRVTLDQAIARATRLDPDYVRALGQVDNAEWGRRAALAVFILPSLTASIDATKYSTEFFNIGTGRNQAEAVNATFTARYELFSVRKFADLGRTAGRAGGRAGQRAAAALPDRAADRRCIVGDQFGIHHRRLQVRAAALYAAKACLGAKDDDPLAFKVRTCRKVGALRSKPSQNLPRSLCHLRMIPRGLGPHQHVRSREENSTLSTSVYAAIGR